MQPTVIGVRVPTAATQRPVKSEASTIPPKRGKKSSANG
jgi:hypothetical protein